ncbi:uncharacterized protein LOC131468870 [Solea solea]|uniref:uncharacterized protein LOC131468870 n=1 Tax=Solea solea TaxID=90069 RepID=UPI00272AD9F1|nr:uncharacterized protein LOC131468870 [Solea solea]
MEVRQWSNLIASTMRVHHFCFFVMLLSDNDNAGLVSAGETAWTGTEGGSITVNCSFFFRGSMASFCKESCDKAGNILVQTDGDRAWNDRYSLEYERKYFLEYENITATITNLKKSDSGWYMCRLKRLLSTAYEKIQIIVKDAPTTADAPPPPSSSSSSTAAAAAATTTASATSQSFTSTSQPVLQPKLNNNVLMYVSLILLFIIIVLSVAVLVFCRNRASKTKESPEKTEEHEVSQVYEEVRDESRHSRALPVEDLTYSLVQFTKPDRDETTDCYTLLTAQNTAGSAAAEHQEQTTVIYFVVQANMSAVSHSDDASFPLYSTVASQGGTQDVYARTTCTNQCLNI